VRKVPGNSERRGHRRKECSARDRNIFRIKDCTRRCEYPTLDQEILAGGQRPGIVHRKKCIGDRKCLGHGHARADAEGVPEERRILFLQCDAVERCFSHATDHKTVVKKNDRLAVGHPDISDNATIGHGASGHGLTAVEHNGPLIDQRSGHDDRALIQGQRRPGLYR